MSGHSKWSTIKHQKAVTDAKRGKLFSKLTKAILVAIKTGGGNNPETNYKLKIAIDAAKNANMPKSNIERALVKGAEAGDLYEVTYEGIGPKGVGIVILAATDNKNRTAAEIKNILVSGGGSLGAPNSVTFNFQSKGLIIIEGKIDDEKMLQLIDLGAEDVETTQTGVKVYTSATDLAKIKEEVTKGGFQVNSFELIQEPNILKPMTDEHTAKIVLRLLNELENHDDVQKVFSDFDISEQLLDKLSN
jgi:YebC/PmpR family DNA-binding regulatory protein